MSAENWQENYLHKFTREELMNFNLASVPNVFPIDGYEWRETKWGRKLLPFTIGSYATREEAEVGLIEVMKWAETAEIQVRKPAEAIIKNMLRNYLIEKEKKNEAVD